MVETPQQTKPIGQIGPVRNHPSRMLIIISSVVAILIVGAIIGFLIPSDPGPTEIIDDLALEKKIADMTPEELEALSDEIVGKDAELLDLPDYEFRKAMREEILTPPPFRDVTNELTSEEAKEIADELRANIQNDLGIDEEQADVAMRIALSTMANYVYLNDADRIATLMASDLTSFEEKMKSPEKIDIREEDLLITTQPGFLAFYTDENSAIVPASTTAIPLGTTLLLSQENPFQSSIEGLNISRNLVIYGPGGEILPELSQADPDYSFVVEDGKESFFQLFRSNTQMDEGDYVFEFNTNVGYLKSVFRLPLTFKREPFIKLFALSGYPNTPKAHQDQVNVLAYHWRAPIEDISQLNISFIIGGLTESGGKTDFEWFVGITDQDNMSIFSIDHESIEPLDDEGVLSFEVSNTVIGFGVNPGKYQVFVEVEDNIAGKSTESTHMLEIEVIP